MPQKADAVRAADIDIDVDKKYIVEVQEITEAPSQWPDAKKGQMSLTWKFRVYDQESGLAIIDRATDLVYEMWNFTPDTTYRNTKTGKTAKAREWTEALLGRELSDPEMNELIDLGFEDSLKGKRGLADLEWYTTAGGMDRLRIIRLRPYRKQAARVPVTDETEPVPVSKSNTDRIAGDLNVQDERKRAERRAALGLDDAA